MMDYLLKNIQTLAGRKKEVTSVDEEVITLRQVLEGKVPQGATDFIPVDIRTSDIAGQFNVGKPVALRKQKPIAPARQTRIGNWNILSVYWQLLKQQKRSGRVNTDHAIGLPAEKWPILKALAADFRRHTKINRWVHPHWYKEYKKDFFVFQEIFQQDLEDLPENWDLDYLFVPMWDGQEPSGGTHAIFMLEWMNGVIWYGQEERESDLPYCVEEHFGHDAALAAQDKMCKALSEGNLKAFPPPWRRSLGWLKSHQLYGLTSYDLEWQGKEIHEPSDILEYFNDFKIYAQMQKITREVYDAFEKDTEAEWIRLFEAFIPKPAVKKHKPKTLIQVFNNGKKEKD